MKTESTEQSDNLITRKEALKKAGKYAAFTAAASIILLTPKPSQAQSNLIDRTGKGWGSTGYSPPTGGISQTPFVKPNDPQTSSSGLKDTPWK